MVKIVTQRLSGKLRPPSSWCPRTQALACHSVVGIMGWDGLSRAPWGVLSRELESAFAETGLEA